MTEHDHNLDPDTLHINDLPEVDTSAIEVYAEPITDTIKVAELRESVEDSPAESKGFIRRNINKLSAGAFLAGLAVSIATKNTGNIPQEIIDAWPYAAGVGVTETAWVGGLAMMLASAGKHIGNPFNLKSRWKEASADLIDSKLFRAGLTINTAGAIGTAVVGEAAVLTTLPPETWPGATVGAMADLSMTVGLRAPVYAKMEELDQTKTEKNPKPKIREATLDDVERLAEIDLLLFDKAYGTDKPEKEEVEEMLRKRISNNPGWMLVAEIGGEIEGFVSAFATDRTVDTFRSWEDSTANGTLDGRVVKDGKYAYVTNMTVKHEAVELGAEDMLLGKLFAKGIKHGFEYTYFVGRMPHFKKWIEENEIDVTEENSDEIAEQYFNLRQEDGTRYDPQIRLYQSWGFNIDHLAKNAFSDASSLDYGVVYKVDVPPFGIFRKIKPLRSLIAKSLSKIAEHPKLLGKVSRFK